MLRRRIVHIEHDALFMTFHRPDLALTAEEAVAAIADLPGDQRIKGVGYGRPAHERGAFRAPGFAASAEDRTLPPATMVITDTKAECKAVHRQLLARPDYNALQYTHADGQTHPLMLPLSTRPYGAHDAFCFRCAPLPAADYSSERGRPQTRTHPQRAPFMNVHKTLRAAPTRQEAKTSGSPWRTLCSRRGAPSGCASASRTSSQRA